MPAPRILPSTAELKKLVDAGLTHAQIAEHVSEQTGERISRSAISSALSRAGLTRETHRYREEVPWRVSTEHLTQYPARMLRLLGRSRAGQELAADERARLDAWLAGLEDRGAVVAYCPDGPGFIYVEADEVGDGAGGVPIRRRLIDVAELP